MVQLLSNQHKVVIHQTLNLLGLGIFLSYPMMVGFDLLFLSTTFIGILISNLVNSAYYHRCLTHKSWKAPTWMHYVFLILGAAFLMLPAIGWVAVHREHHKFYDTDKDPHGPSRGFFVNLFTSMIEPKLRYMRKEIRNDKLLWQVKYYWWIAIANFIFLTYFFNIASYFLLIGYIYLSILLVNFLGHYRKLNNYHLPSLFLAGELYHKNHHEDQTNPKFGMFDLPYYLLIKWFL